MKAFFKDYWDLCKQSGDFYKDEIVETVKEKLPKRKES